MELSVDKHLKLDKPLEPIYLSHKPHPIKVVETALSVDMKADEIAKETAKTGKVSAVVAVRGRLYVPLLKLYVCRMFACIDFYLFPR